MRDALVALLVLLGGCRASWDYPMIDYAMVPLPSGTPCAELVAEARERGLSVIVNNHTHVLAWDETILLRGELKRLHRSGRYLHAQRIREIQATLVCGSTAHTLPVRTCRIRGRAYGVFDLQALEGVTEVGQLDAPCLLNFNLRTGNRWSPWMSSQGHTAIVRRSPRAILEGGR